MSPPRPDVRLPLPRRVLRSAALIALLLAGGPLVPVAGNGFGLARAAELTRVVTDRSTLGFAYKQMGVPMEGKFRKFSAQLAFDAAHPEQARVSFEVDVASIDAGSAEANDEIGGKLWFNTKAFPLARFTATSVRSTGAGKFEAAGKLLIKGQSRDVVAPFTVSAQGADSVIEGVLPIRRGDFGIGEGMWADYGTVANEVAIRFRLLAAAR